MSAGGPTLPRGAARSAPSRARMRARNTRVMCPHLSGAAADRPVRGVRICVRLLVHSATRYRFLPPFVTTGGQSPPADPGATSHRLAPLPAQNRPEQGPNCPKLLHYTLKLVDYPVHSSDPEKRADPSISSLRNSCFSVFPIYGE